MFVVLEHKDECGNLIFQKTYPIKCLIDGDVICYDSGEDKNTICFDKFQWNFEKQDIEHIEQSGKDVKLLFVDFD